MKKSRFTEEQIIFALKQAELGTPVPEVCRKSGISDAMFYTWRKKYGGILPPELKHMCQLEEENLRLKKRVANLNPDKATHYGASERWVCFALRLRICESTETRVHYGYLRVHILLRRDGLAG